MGVVGVLLHERVEVGAGLQAREELGRQRLGLGGRARDAGDQALDGDQAVLHRDARLGVLGPGQQRVGRGAQIRDRRGRGREPGRRGRLGRGGRARRGRAAREQREQEERGELHGRASAARGATSGA